MTLTPAQRHFLATSAAMMAISHEDTQPTSVRNQYELMLAKLDTDKRRLKEVLSLERRTEIKREIVPEYQDWLNGALSNDKGTQDDVVVTILVWMLDIGQYKEAMPVAEYAIKSDMVMPDQFERNLATFIVDEVSDAALNAQKENKHFEFDVLKKVHEMTQGFDMPDVAKAKLLKAIGYEHHAVGELEQALEVYQRAYELNDRIGVKKLIQAIEKKLSID